ncbi:protocadherin gamma-A12-like [Engraulis encrasicolus]|uniref:protocadherin gamma-A12-like n=1 Tax=Engraulis encrasicolus TaxID=184585 RepID=UPI002FCEA9BC
MKTGSSGSSWTLKLFLLFASALVIHGQVRYSIPEEMPKGSVVGNIVQDLGLDVKRLKTGRARIFSEGSREYIALNNDRGTLIVKEKIDREEMCGQVTPCSLYYQIILENPVDLHGVDVEILDINDNAPLFPHAIVKLKISEGSVVGTRFPLENAVDSDVEVNSIQSYSLVPSEHFKLNQQSHSDGSQYLEMVLQTTLDRENAEQHILTLTAVDGGSPSRTGTVKIHIDVLDVNDNAPVFTSRLYKASLSEDSPKGTVVLTVSASDADAGVNGEVSYSFSHSMDSMADVFDIDSTSGDIKVVGNLDFENKKQYKIDVKASDKGHLTDTAKVLIDVLDVNDNAPVITVMTFSDNIPENAPPDTVVAVLNVKDLDSDKNGDVRLHVDKDVPFKIKSSSANIFRLVTDQELDRERVPQYNITLTATDQGTPSHSTTKVLLLKVSDINDNAPAFESGSYTAYVMENNAPGLSVYSVKASDKDTGHNARISYYLEETQTNNDLISTYVSINSESGVIHAVRAFDFEQMKELRIRVKALDGGSPPLSSNATVTIVVTDQNDNTPQVLYPVQTSSSMVAEIVPRSADIGYLVTKVVAVDVDSGQNAWLSYKLQKAADRPLFEVGAQNGEIRTVRQVTDKDAVKQKLTVIVEDNGQPSRSATVTVNVAVADSFPEVLSEFTEFTHDKDYNNNLTFFLLLALIVVSILFIFSVIAIISVKIYRWRQRKLFYKSANNLPVIPYYPTPTMYSDGTLHHTYNYEMCGTTDSRMTDVKPMRPYSQSTLVSLSRPGTVQRQQKQQQAGDADDISPEND